MMAQRMPLLAHVDETSAETTDPCPSHLIEPDKPLNFALHP